MTLTAPSAEPASGGAPKQLVVFVHGYGASGDDLMPLAEPLATVLPDAAFVSPHAPDTVPDYPQGRQWFGLSNLGADELKAGVQKAGPILNGFIDEELSKRGLTGENLAIVGFSQGAMLALHCGLRRDPAPAAIIGYSGGFVNDDELQTEIIGKPPVFLAHGEDDPVVKPESLEISSNALGRLGFRVICRKSPGVAHAIAPDGLQIGASFLKQAFSGELDVPEGVHEVMATSQ